MNQPVVSVVVPIFKVEKYIERCARTIFEQIYENLEIIFVNDCSPDRSVAVLQKVLEEYPDRVGLTRIINHERNLGSAGARLTGLQASTGKYVLNIDSDDYIDREMIPKMVSLAEKENADITICDFMYVYSDKYEHIHVNPPLNPLKCMEAVLVGTVHSSVCNKLIQRSLFVDNNIYFIVGLNMNEDLSVMFRLLYFAKKIAYVDKPYYKYNLCNGQSFTKNSYSEKSQKNMVQIVELCQSFSTQNHCQKEILQAIRYLQAWTYCTIALKGNWRVYGLELCFQKMFIGDIVNHPFMSRAEKIAGELMLKNKYYCLVTFRIIVNIAKRIRTVRFFR